MSFMGINIKNSQYLPRVVDVTQPTYEIVQSTGVTGFTDSRSNALHLQPDVLYRLITLR